MYTEEQVAAMIENARKEEIESAEKKVRSSSIMTSSKCMMCTVGENSCGSLVDPQHT